MKFSISWLNDYTPIEMDPADLADALTMAGLEVESVTDRYAYLDSVLVGCIEEINPHPNADKLTLCRVTLGDRRLTVVCGAPNVEPGMLAPLALPGTVLADGSTLEKSVIRGEPSEGMLCSEAELGLGADKSGILTLEPSLTLGAKLSDALGKVDTVYEMDLTPNRPDCLGIIGIAREIAAIQNTPLKYPDTTLVDKKDTLADLSSVQVEAPDHCPRYAARLIENIKIESSPFWLQDRLLSVGLRPISNIVDITNFVMMEACQPLHAFDFDRLAENRIVVRTANAGETFTTLDGKERKLSPEMLMICDGEKPVAIGGVMGGLNSEIEMDSTRVLIESAYFSPNSIRKTSKSLGLNTDASHRFERGIDPRGTIVALNRAARLMIEITGGKLIDGVIDAHPGPQELKRLVLSTQKTNRLLGTRLTRNDIGELLSSIEFSVEPQKDDAGKDALIVQAPSFRVDITRPEDLMEEVARRSGYNNIPTTYPLMPADARSPSRAIDIRNQIKAVMTGFGFMEAITYSFMPKAACDHLRLNGDDARRSLVNILNPLTEDQAVMRTSILPGLLETVRHNFSQHIKDLKLFEIGKIFVNTSADALPVETEMLVGLWTGSRRDPSWHSKQTACDFFDIKGISEGLLGALKLEAVKFTALSEDTCTYTRPGHSARILAGQVPLGIVGELHPEVLTHFDLPQQVFIFELDVEQMTHLIPQATESQPIPKFPAVFRDITIHISQEVETQHLLDTLAGLKQELVEGLELLDVFAGDPIPAGKKSVSMRITYRSTRKTLEDEDVHDLHKSMADKLVKTFDATLPA
jgi:phenylalanyl-tRNA synthetase beta chain